MAPRTLDEIFEECLSAYREGRRGVEESLALYPDSAEELGLLLRTVFQIDAGVHIWSPSEELEERVRERFLAAATKRRRERMTFERPSRWRWGFIQNRSFAVGTAVAILAVVALTLSAVTLLGDGDDGSSGVLVEILPSSTPVAAPAVAETATPPAAVVTNIASQVEQARADLTVIEEVVERGDPIQTEEIGALAETTREIAAQLDGVPAGLEEVLDEGGKEALVAVISDGFALLSSLDEADLSENDLEDVKAVLALTEEIAAKLGLPLITLTPVAEPTPTPISSPAPGAIPTSAPTEVPALDPTPTPMPGVVPEPTPPLPSGAASGAVLFDAP